jgi:hypothetical protein
MFRGTDDEDGTGGWGVSSSNSRFDIGAKRPGNNHENQSSEAAEVCSSFGPSGFVVLVSSKEGCVVSPPRE